MEVVCSDIVGPFNTGEKKFKHPTKFYFITFVDIYSRGLHVFLLEEITSSTVTESLKSFIQKFGVPKRIHNNNGIQYISNEFNHVCRADKIEHTYSPRNSPQSNGVAKRLNSNIKTIMRIYQDFDLEFIISRIHNFHNHLFHSRLQLSPNEIITNIIPFHILFENNSILFGIVPFYLELCILTEK